MGFGIGNGIAKLVQRWGKGISNAADKVWLRADAQKAIRDEVLNKYKPRIDHAQRVESERAKNIKDLGDKLDQSKKDLQDAQKVWQDKYDAALADAKSKRQTDINDYDQQLKSYEDALNKAEADKQSIFDQLHANEAQYNQNKTIFTDVNTGERYIFNPITGSYENLAKVYKRLGTVGAKAQRKFMEDIKDYDNRLFDQQSNRVINAFDDLDSFQYKGQKPAFDTYYNNKMGTRDADLRNAENQINKADSELNSWKTNNSKPQDWDDNVDLKSFEKDFKSKNSKPTYSFNGQTYSKKSDLKKAYNEALDNEKRIQDAANKALITRQSKQDAEIAQRIQDAKDMNKAKVALGGTLGAGTLYAAARAMYGGHDTDNPDNIDNTNNTDNTNNGEPDPHFNVKNIPGAKDLINDRQPDTGFDPDKANALASASYDEGVEDGNSIASSDDLGNRIKASTGGHTIDDELYKLLKDMQDPYKADAVANYIYSKHGNNPEVQRLGWRGWLNKYYGDALRSIMNIDPSGYKGMHISGGL